MMYVWRPIVDRGDGAWLGTIGDGQLWVGTWDAARSAVRLSDPVSLWPLLERPIDEIAAELADRWHEFGLPEALSYRTLVELIVRSAAAAGRTYWVDRTLDWLATMSGDIEYTREAIISALQLIQHNENLPQSCRHRARRIMRPLGSE